MIIFFAGRPLFEKRGLPAPLYQKLLTHFLLLNFIYAINILYVILSLPKFAQSRLAERSKPRSEATKGSRNEFDVPCQIKVTFITKGIDK